MEAALEPDDAASDNCSEKMSKNVEILLIHGGSQPTKSAGGITLYEGLSYLTNFECGP